jgi:hypothetical protein
MQKVKAVKIKTTKIQWVAYKLVSTKTSDAALIEMQRFNSEDEAHSYLPLWTDGEYIVLPIFVNRTEV